MILTVDIGNSRIKYASWRSDRIVDRGVVTYAKDNPSESFDPLFSVNSAMSGERPSRVCAVCVAGDDISQALSEWVKQHWQLDVEYLKTEKQYEDIVNAYQDPAQHGVDRWAGIVAAHLRFPDRPVCVIGAGTAITFDLMTKNGRHQGGYILPSYATMHAALMSDTANVESTHSESADSMKFDECGIPDNTNDAVNQGLHRFIRAGVRDLCQFAEDNMDESMKLIITGGSAETILAYPGMPVMLHEPDLVMQGLYTIMKQRKGSNG